MIKNKNILYVLVTLFLTVPMAFADKTPVNLENFGRGIIKNTHTIKNETDYPATLKLFFRGESEPLEIQLKRRESTTLQAPTQKCLEKVEFAASVIEVAGGKYIAGAKSTEANFNATVTIPQCAPYNFIISLKAYTELISPTPYLRRNSLQFVLSVTAKNSSIGYEAMSNKEIFESGK